MKQTTKSAGLDVHRATSTSAMIAPGESVRHQPSRRPPLTIALISPLALTCKGTSTNAAAEPSRPQRSLASGCQRSGQAVWACRLDVRWQLGVA